MTSYEEARLRIEAVPTANDPGIRDVKWMTESHTIGVSRDPSGRVEIFMRGPELRASSRVVRESMEFRIIHRDGSPDFDANLLVLPALAYFDQVAAFICAELLRCGADSSLAQAFLQTEPLIELAIERMRLSSEAILGLAGELLLIDALCRKAKDAKVANIISGWDGWRRSARDLTIGTTGIEVKTTTGSSSSHIVEGVHQVERSAESVEGTSEDRLLLVSIGLQVATDGGNTFTIPQLMESILNRTSAAGLTENLIDKFIQHVSEYGATSVEGYDHRTQASNPVYATTFLTSFFRAYDMSDSAIEVLRRSDVVTHAHVAVDSVRFRVDLPLTAGAGNPVTGANQVAEEIINSTN